MKKHPFKFRQKLRVTRNNAARLRCVKRGDVVWFRCMDEAPQYDRDNEYCCVFSSWKNAMHEGPSVGIRLDALIPYKKYQRLPKP